MWPFRKREQAPLPPWTFEMVHDAVEAKVAPGRWLITDGADCSNDAVLMGDLANDWISVTPEFNEEGIKRLTVACRVYGEREPRDGDEELVVDSGDLVICCQPVFDDAAIARGDSAYRLLSSAHRQWQDASVILVRDEQSLCVGIIAAPRWGDGSYAIQTRRNGAVCSKHIELQESL